MNDGPSRFPMSIVTLRWMVFVMMALVNFVSADVLPSKSIDVDMVGPCLSRHQAWHPRVFYGFPSHTSPAELPFMGRGVRIAVLDTGIADEYVKRSASHMECHSFVPGVACGDQGCEHGTVSASILAGRIYVAGLPPEDSTPPQTVAPSSWKHATTDVRIDHEYVGIAPESHLTMMRVFDHQGRTTPAYLLRALQAARRMRADVISLSYGTEGGMDSRVRTLLKELAASGVVIVAAAGNAGPRFGSVLSPGDMAEVLTVGSMSVECFRPHTRCELVRRVAHFSGRGPTLDEQPYGSGRVKPDVVALGTSILAVREEVGNSGGANNFTRLRLVAAHGTSASTPLVAGLVALCIQALRHHGVESIHAAAIKSVIMTTARIITPPTFVAHTFLGANYSRQFHQSYQRTMDRYVHLLSYSMMSQGAGEVNLLGALQHIQTMQLQQWSTYVLPSRMHLNGTSACAYDWPMCAQPLYPGGLPQRFNFTTVVSPPSKGTGLTVRRSNTSFSVLSVEVGSKSAPLEWVNRFATMLLVLEVEAPLELASSYTGTIGVLVSCPEAAAEVPMPDGLHLPNGLLLPAGGDVSVEIVGEMRVEYCQEGNTCTQLPVPFSVSVVPPPPREQRVLLDSAHQWFNPKTTAQHARNVSQDVFVAGDDPHEGVPFTDGATSHLSREYAERDGDGLTTSGALVYLFLRHELHLFVHDFPLLLSDEVVEGLQLQDASATHRDQLRQRIGRVQQEVLQRRIGSIIMLDGEVPLSTETRKLLADASRNHGLNILLLTDWYSVELAQHLRWSGGEEQEGADELRAWHPLGHHGLAGSTHIPSINALLRQELQLPSLQLSESEVVDGVLAIPDEMGGWRGVGRLNGAGVLLHDLNHSIAPPPTGASIAVCNTHPTWSLRQRQLRKEAIPQATEMLRDVWVRLNHTPPHQHRGVFGFVTSTNPSMGRVTIFTDTNCLSAADPYILREVRGRITHRGHHPLNQTLQLGVTELHVPGHACLEVLRELMSAVLGGRITWTAHLTSSGGSTDHCSARHPSLPLTWAKEKQTPALVCSCSHGSASHTIATSVVPKKQNWSAAAPPLLEHRLHTAVTVWELFLRRWSTTASVSPETSNSVSTTSAPRTLRNLRKDTHASDPFPLTHHHQLPILASVLMLSVAAASVILIAARIKRQGRWRQRRLHRHHQWVD